MGAPNLSIWLGGRGGGRRQIMPGPTGNLFVGPATDPVRVRDVLSPPPFLGVQAGFYVAQSGNNLNAGTITSPWRTIQYAVGQLAPGQQLWIRGGTWNERIRDVYFNNEGTAGNPITVSGFPGETVILRPDTTVAANGNVMGFEGMSYLTFTDLILDGTDVQSTLGEVLYVAGSLEFPQLQTDHFRFERVIMRNGGGNGALIGGDSHYFLDCQWLSNGWNTSYTESNGMYGGFMTNCTIKGGIAYNNEGYGIRCYNSGHTPLVPDNPASGNVIDGVLSYQNGAGRGLNSGSQSQSGGGGFVVGDDNLTVMNCLAYDNYWGLQDTNDSVTATGIKIYNNTFTLNDNGMSLWTSLNGTFTVRNNIITGNLGADFDTAFGNANITQSNNITSGSVNFVNAGARDFHLASSATNAINQGTTVASVTTDFDGLTRPQGSAYDIGAYEAAFFVSPSGSNSNPGTLTQPFATLQFAVSQLSTGTVLYVRAGNYLEGLSGPNFGAFGTSFANAPQIIAYNGETVTLQKLSLTGSASYRYLIFQGLIFDASTLSSDQPIYIDNSAGFIRFIDCIFTGGRTTGAITIPENGAGGNEILGGRVHNNGISTQFDHGLYIKCGGNILRGVEVDHNTASGIQFYNSGTAMPAGNVVDGCHIHDNTLGIFLWDLDNGSTLVNSLVVNNTDYGISINNGTVSTIYNNTVSGNGTGIDITNCTITLRNNIFWGNGDEYSYTSGTVTASHNLSDDGDLPGSNNVTTNPLFVGAADYHLQAGSPARNAGTTTGAPSQAATDYDGMSRGATYDIGAYEATGLFVSLSGNDGNAGTFEQPWATIKFALTQASAGDTIWLRGGNHSANLHQASTTAWNSGTSYANAITIRAYPGETVNITAQLGYDYAGDPARYHIWQDVHFNGNHNGCVYTSDASHHIRFQDCEITNNNTIGQGVAQDADAVTSHHYEFLNCEIHHCGNQSNLDHGLYLQCSEVLVEGCDIHHNFANGWQQYPQGSNNIYRNNLVHHNGACGAVLWAGSGNQFYNNVVYNNATNGLQLTNQSTAVAYFNTFYSNGNFGIEQFGGSSGTNTAKNNINYNNAGGDINVLAGSLTQSNNSPNSTNPQFVSLTAGAEDFHLTASTPGSIVNAGVAIPGLTTDHDGVTRADPPDLGAYEFVG